MVTPAASTFRNPAKLSAAPRIRSQKQETSWKISCLIGRDPAGGYHPLLFLALVYVAVVIFLNSLTTCSIGRLKNPSGSSLS